MTTATRPDPPAVHVLTRGRVDPAVVGYALDRLRDFDADQHVDTVRVELTHQGHRVRIELSAALPGRVVRAANSGASPRAVIDRAHGEITEQIDLATRQTRLQHRGRGSA